MEHLRVAAALLFALALVAPGHNGFVAAEEFVSSKFNTIMDCRHGYEPVTPNSGIDWDITDFKAYLEMNVNPTYAWHYDREDPADAARHASSRTQLRVEFNVNENLDISATGRQVDLYLNVNTCSGGFEKWLHDPNDPNSDIEDSIRAEPGANAVTTDPKPFLVDFDAVGSVVIKENASQETIACCNLIPPFPDFPDQFHTTIEGNIVDKRYSFVRNEVYDHDRQLIRFDGETINDDGTVQHIWFIQDFDTPGSEIIELVSANATYPNGACVQREGGFGRFADGDGHLKSTRDFLGMAETAAYVPGGNEAVRGIECEAWGQLLTGQDGKMYQVTFYFPLNDWTVSRMEYHRLPKRIVLEGVAGTPAAGILHYYDFVGFTPFLPNNHAFSPCYLLPAGEGCGCGDSNVSPECAVSIAREVALQQSTCDMRVAAARTGGPCDPAVADSDGDVGENEGEGEGEDEVAAGRPAAKKCDKWTKHQSGQYVVCAFVSLLVGAVAGGLVAFVVMRRAIERARLADPAAAPVRGATGKSVELSDNPAFTLGAGFPAAAGGGGDKSTAPSAPRAVESNSIPAAIDQEAPLRPEEP